MSDLATPTKKREFSLIELLMILMLVGIIFTLIIPIREDRRNHERVREAIQDIQKIAKANIAFKNDPENGYYAFDLGQLNIDDQLQMNYFNYTLNDTTVVAVSNENYSVEGAEFFYYLPAGPWMVKDNEHSREVIDPNWLP
jgi:Tfp pilus assembly protein PilE